VSDLALLMAVVLALAAFHELAGTHGDGATAFARRLRRRLEAGPAGRLLGTATLGAASGTGARIRAAGLQGRLGARGMRWARAASAALALPAATALAPAAPGRSAALVVCGLPCAAAVAPDLVLARLARRRRRVIAASMPGALELMAVRARAGGGPRSLLGDAHRAMGAGPLRDELAGAWAELDCGVPGTKALDRLGREGGPDLAALAVSIERSRRLGAPLAAGLQNQAESLRVERGRAITDEAARAAPKIQLVVALLLVPSVLLLVAAAIAANADALLSGLG
jgi:tight adherence protein C